MWEAGLIFRPNEHALSLIGWRRKRKAAACRRSHAADCVTGLELLPKAKAVRPDVPVIMITAYGDAETKRKALEGGAEALFTKPIDFRALRSEIDTRVERAA